jgi:hypothetical protein
MLSACCLAEVGWDSSSRRLQEGRQDVNPGLQIETWVTRRSLFTLLGEALERLWPRAGHYVWSEALHLATPVAE